MSRVMNLSLSEAQVLDHCKSKSIGISALEPLPGGGVRLVCMSSEGAEQVRKTFKSKLIDMERARTPYRPAHPSW
ncbi:MAG TPA: hypothetical protein VM265_03605 [Sphingomicrobium sp.]|nr:hypothetical protein [Sphingomicrobium sp.]